MNDESICDGRKLLPPDATNMALEYVLKTFNLRFRNLDDPYADIAGSKEATSTSTSRGSTCLVVHSPARFNRFGRVLSVLRSPFVLSSKNVELLLLGLGLRRKKSEAQRILSHPSPGNITFFNFFEKSKNGQEIQLYTCTTLVSVPEMLV